MNKDIVFILIIQLYVSTLVAQNTYSMSYDVSNASNWAPEVARADNDEMYILDYARCPDRVNTGCIALRKFSTEGIYRWTKSYDLNPPFQYRGGGQGCLAVQGGEIALVGDEERRPDYHRYFIGFWDTSGVLLDTFFYDFVPAIGNSFVRSVEKYNDTTYYVLGNEELAPTNNTLYLSKIHRNGQEVWRRHFGAGLDWLPDPQILQIFQDSLLLIACTEKFGLEREALAICTDLDGNEKWMEFVEPEVNLSQVRA